MHPPEVPTSTTDAEGQNEFSPLVDTAHTPEELQKLIERSVLDAQARARHELERHSDHQGL